MWITTNCGKVLKKWEYQTTLLVSWETCMQVKKRQNRMWNNHFFQIGKGVCQDCILSPCLFNITWNAGMDESQAGIKIAWRNINNLRYAGFNPCVGKIPSKRDRLPTPVFFPGKFQRQRNLATVHGISTSQTRLSNFHSDMQIIPLYWQKVKRN